MFATGLISGKGTFIGIGNGKNSSLAELPGGTFVVTHPHSQSKVLSESANSTTCAARFVQRSPYTISKGTGKFKGISGSGTAIVTSVATLPKLKTGKCDLSPNAIPLAGSVHTGIKALFSIALHGIGSKSYNSRLTIQALPDMPCCF